MCSICVLDAAERCLLDTVNGKVKGDCKKAKHTEGALCVGCVVVVVRNLEFIALKECPVDSLATKER